MNLLSITRAVEVETAGVTLRAVPPDRANREAVIRVVSLFLLVALGILVSFFWPNLWAVANNGADWDTPSWSALIARTLISFVLAALTFLGIYNKINTDKAQSTSQSWAAWFIAFQSGFAWQSLVEGAAAKTAAIATAAQGASVVIIQTHSLFG